MKSQTPQPIQIQPFPDMDEDETNLLDLMLVLVKHKIMIIGLVLLTGLAALIYSLKLTNIYRSEATIALRSEGKNSTNPLAGLGGIGGIMAGQLLLGGGGTLEKLEVVLQSRNLTSRVINKYNLMPLIFSEVWDADKKKWNTDSPPTLQDGWNIMKGMLKVKSDSRTNTIKVGVEHEGPETAKKFVEYYLTELSETLREEVLHDSAENMHFFREQLSKTSDTLLKEKIYTMLVKEIERDTFARAQKYYSFVVLDPPIVPDSDKRVKPKRSIICLLSVTLAFFIAIFLAFLTEFFQHIRLEDQDRYQKIVQGIKIWNNHKQQI